MKHFKQLSISFTFIFLMFLFIQIKPAMASVSYENINASSDQKKADRTVNHSIFKATMDDEYAFCFTVTRNGVKKKLTVMKGADSSIITNGYTIYYAKQTNGKYALYKTNIKNKKPVKIGSMKTIDNAAGIHCYTNGYAYYVAGMDPGTLYRMNLKTGKSEKIATDVTNTQLIGSYIALRPYCGDVSPISLRIYNTKTGKIATISKKQLGYSITQKYVYYAEFLGVDDTNGMNSNNRLRIIRKTLDGKNKKVLCSELVGLATEKITSKKVVYHYVLPDNKYKILTKHF